MNFLFNLPFFLFILGENCLEHSVSAKKCMNGLGIKRVIPAIYPLSLHTRL